MEDRDDENSGKLRVVDTQYATLGREETTAVRRVCELPAYARWLYKVVPLNNHRGPRWGSTACCGMAWLFRPGETRAMPQCFDAWRFMSNGVSFWRVPPEHAERMNLSRLKDDPAERARICELWTRMCFPGCDSDRELSLATHFNARVPQFDVRPWTALLDDPQGRGASFLGLYCLNATRGGAWANEFWIGVHTGARKASSQLVEMVRKAGGRMTLRMLAESPEARFVEQAGQRTRQRLLAAAWLLLGGDPQVLAIDMHSTAARDRYDPCARAAFNDFGNVSEEDLADFAEQDAAADACIAAERLLPPTVEYTTHRLEMREEEECVYYAGAVNAARMRSHTVVLQSPQLGPVLLHTQHPGTTWRYPSAFPVSTGPSVARQDVNVLFEPDEIRIPDDAVLSVLPSRGIRDVVVCTVNGITFGFPVIREQQRLGGSGQPTFFNHRIMDRAYYRTRVELASTSFERTLGMHPKATEAALFPVITVLPATRTERIHFK